MNLTKKIMKNENLSNALKENIFKDLKMKKKK